MTRSQYLSDLIGKPWQSNGAGPDFYDCWHLALEVQQRLFAQTLPEIRLPSKPTWQWMIEAFRTHPEKEKWSKVPYDQMGLVTAKDGSLVLMARLDRPAHIGVWLEKERGIIHADQRGGVMMESVSTLKTKGWRKLMFIRRVDEN